MESPTLGLAPALRVIFQQKNPVFSVTRQSPAILVSLAPPVHVELSSITAAFILEWRNLATNFSIFGFPLPDELP